MDNTASDNLIDWKLALRKVWYSKSKLFLVVTTCALIGAIIAFQAPIKYSSSTVFIPTSSSTSTGGLGELGGLASLAGVNLNTGDNTAGIPPALYPKLAKSVRFKQRLINSQFFVKDLKDSISYKEYYLSYYKPPFVQRTLKLILSGLYSIQNTNGSNESISFGSEIFIINKDEEEIFSILDRQLSILPNKKDGFVEIKMETENAEISAQMVYNVREILKEELTQIKVKNATEQLDFTLSQFKEKQKEFISAQNALAVFQDRNQNISTSTARSEERQLEAEYNLKQSIFNEISQQLENAKLQVKRETPSFSILQDIAIPLEKSSPNRAFIVIVSTLLGIVVFIGIILLRMIVENIKSILVNESTK